MPAISCLNPKTNYTASDFYSTYNENQVTKCNERRPAVTEVMISTIAHDLFPNNFAWYKFFNPKETGDLGRPRAGYVLEYDQVECGAAPLGVEKVYGTALFLGLKIKSHFCISKEGQTYLYIDEFYASLHQINLESGGLIDEYRGSKDNLSAPGLLFPRKFMNEACGQWIGAQCDLEKLNQTYELIINTQLSEPCHIIDIAINVSRSIERQSREMGYQSENTFNYEEFHDYLAYRTARLIVSNYIDLRALYFGKNATDDLEC